MLSPESRAIAPARLRYLQERVHADTGIVLGDEKAYLFETRLAPILRERKLASIDDLCCLLQTDDQGKLARLVVEAMTTNETYFFRDPAQYEAIRRYLLPGLRQDRSDTKQLKFWSAAASTGQEAYSLAMLLREECFGDWNIDITATDFCSQAVERARSGCYQQIEVNRGLPASLLVRYFMRRGLEWHIHEDVRSMVRFECGDLRQIVRTAGPFDLVFCRNVLIYFDTETRRRILAQLHETLFRGGWLLLGGAEAAFDVDRWFERRSVADATVYVAR